MPRHTRNTCMGSIKRRAHRYIGEKEDQIWKMHKLAFCMFVFVLPSQLTPNWRRIDNFPWKKECVNLGAALPFVSYCLLKILVHCWKLLFCSPFLMPMVTKLLHSSFQNLSFSQMTVSIWCEQIYWFTRILKYSNKLSFLI